MQEKQGKALADRARRLVDYLSAKGFDDQSIDMILDFIAGDVDALPGVDDLASGGPLAEAAADDLGVRGGNLGVRGASDHSVMAYDRAFPGASKIGRA